jgi:hypothetical protein
VTRDNFNDEDFYLFKYTIQKKYVYQKMMHNC